MEVKLSSITVLKCFGVQVLKDGDRRLDIGVNLVNFLLLVVI